MGHAQYCTTPRRVDCLDCLCRGGNSIVKMYWVPHLKPILREMYGTDSLRDVEKRFSELLEQGFDPVSPVTLFPRSCQTNSASRFNCAASFACARLFHCAPRCLLRAAVMGSYMFQAVFG
jgi:hypothetical protein